MRSRRGAAPDSSLPGDGAGTRRVRHGGVEVVVTHDVDEPDQGDAGGRGRRDLVERGQVVRYECRLEQKILGGIPRDGELREGRHVGALALDVRQALDDAGGIALDLTHDRIELAQRHAQVGHDEILPAPLAEPAWQAAVMAASSPADNRRGGASTRVAPVPAALAHLAERSASPPAASATLHRLVDERPEVVDRLMLGSGPSPLALALVQVSAASDVLGRLCVVDPAALDVLEELHRPVSIDTADPAALARSKRLELLRIAGRDLLGLDALETVGVALADLAQQVLGGAVSLASDDKAIAVIGMGKLGGRELNYASDVDVLFLCADGPDEDSGTAHPADRTPVLPGRRRPSPRRAIGPPDTIARQLPRLLGPMGRGMGIPGAPESARRRRRPGARPSISRAPRSSRCGGGATAPTSWLRCGP